MSDGTKIEWCDATVNAINGCSLASPGCTNCYAMKQAHRFPVRQGLTVPSKGGMVWTGEVRLSETALLQPLRWRRPRTIFWNAHGDTFHDKVPDDWIDRMFAVMALTPQHKHLVLTKRSARMRAYFNGPYADGNGVCARVADQIQALANTPGLMRPGPIGAKVWMQRPIGPMTAEGVPEFGFRAFIFPNMWPLPNVWLGVSVEDQARAAERIPDLLATPAAGRFLSCEPLLGPVDLATLQEGLPVNAWLTWLDGLDGVIVGGESGPGARPMHPDWARSLRDQCAAAGVDFHFKLWGDWRMGDELLGEPPRARESGFWRIGKKAAGRMLDGVQHDALPWAHG